MTKHRISPQLLKELKSRKVCFPIEVNKLKYCYINFCRKLGAVIGYTFYKLKAKDPDVTSQDLLRYSVIEPITALDKDGRAVHLSKQSYKVTEIRVFRKLDQVQSIFTPSILAIFQRGSRNGRSEGSERSDQRNRGGGTHDCYRNRYERYSSSNGNG